MLSSSVRAFCTLECGIKLCFQVSEPVEFVELV